MCPYMYITVGAGAWTLLGVSKCKLIQNIGNHTTDAAISDG